MEVIIQGIYPITYHYDHFSTDTLTPKQKKRRPERSVTFLHGEPIMRMVMELSSEKDDFVADENFQL